MTIQHKGNTDYITIPPALDRETAKEQALNLSRTIEHEADIIKSERVLIIKQAKQ